MSHAALETQGTEEGIVPGGSGSGRKRRSRRKSSSQRTAVEETTNPNDNMAATHIDKLDSLCNFLDTLVVEHKGKSTSGSNFTATVPNALLPSAKSVAPAKEITNKASNAPNKKQNTPKGSPNKTVSEPKINGVENGKGNSTKNVTDVNSPKKTTDGIEGKTGNQEEGDRAAIEAERKARKEAKKAKKTGDKSKAGVEDENKQENKENLNQASQPSDSNKENEGKSKADLKRERREKQEAQRAAKLAEKAKADAKKKETETPKSQNAEDKSRQKSPDKTLVKKKSTVTKKDDGRRIPLLAHLTPYSPEPPKHPINSESIHPAIRSLGLKMKTGELDGSTARVLGTLSAIKRLISDYRTPEACDLSRDLAQQLVPNIKFLQACRPLAIAMDNSIRFVKHAINSIAAGQPEAQAKEHLRESIDAYINDNIVLAATTIAQHAAKLLQPGEVIATFGYSAMVLDVVDAVIGSGGCLGGIVVVDAPQPASGLAMVKHLAKRGVRTHYRLITDVTHIMDKVTKVMVEADAVMMNGAIQAVCGTAALALTARTHDKPFIVLSQTYKFCNNDLTDSLVVNEMGDSDNVVGCPSRQYCGILSSWRESHNLNVVSLVYDVTPESLVTALVTEQSVLPTSAVPVIIRRNYADILGQD